MIDALRRYPGLSAGTFFAFAILVGLGLWQVDRLHQKEALIAAIEAGLDGPTQPLPAVIPDPAAWVYKRVTVAGRFDHAHEMHLFSPSVEGKAGYHVLTPLVREDGGTVLVDRGWVPETRLDPATRRAGQITGPVVIAGITRVPRVPGFFVPAPDLARNQWFGVDLDAMGAASGYSLVPVLVEADRTANPGGLPVGGQTRVRIPNDHLQYAGTWFGLAATLLVIYVVYVRRRR